MSIKTKIIGQGNGVEAKITSRGELVTAPLDYSSAYYVSAASDNTAYNFIAPIGDKRFVITGILLDAGKNVSNTTAGTVVVYEAVSGQTTTASKTLLSIEMLRNTSRVISGISVITTEGVFINIKTTDAEVSATLLGYYVDA